MVNVATIQLTSFLHIFPKQGKIVKTLSVFIQ